MATVSAESYSLGKLPEQTAINYLIQCGYGQDYYSEEDIRQMLHELSSVSALWPAGSNSKMIDHHALWRERYYKYWFRKWHQKIRRK